MKRHRWQPTRPCSPWGSLGKNTGVGCHFLLQCMKVKSESEVTQSCLTLSDPMDCSLPGSPVHGIHTFSVLYCAHLCMKCSVGILNFLEEISAAAAAAKSLQSCPILCDPIDSSPPGSAIPGILQARILEWVAISFSNA